MHCHTVDHIPPAHHTVAPATWSTLHLHVTPSRLPSGPCGTYTRRSCTRQPNHPQPLHGIFATAPPDRLPPARRIVALATWTSSQPVHRAVASAGRTGCRPRPGRCHTGGRDRVPARRCAPPPAAQPGSHLRPPSPGPTYAPLPAPPRRSAGTSAAPSSTSQPPAGGFPPRIPAPPHRLGPEESRGEDAQPGCEPGRGGFSPTSPGREDPAPAIARGGAQPYRGGLLRAGGGEARRGAADRDPSAGARSHRALPARGSRARFRGGARAVRRGGGSGPAPPGSCLPARRGLLPRRPRPAPCRG